MSDATRPSGALVEQASTIIIKKHEIDQLYEAQERAMNEFIVFFGRAVLFAMVYWSLWPLFRYGRLAQWAETRKRALWDYAIGMDERKERVMQACVAAGYPNGVIPR